MSETWVRNCWYVAAPSHEIGRQLLARTFLNQPVVLYRKEGGTAVALEDRCSHRFLPLSKGFLVGDRVQCGYHGMEFSCNGVCEHVPGQKSVPAGADIRSFPIAEKWQFVWIWMGDPALADEDLIPDIPRNDHPDWTPIVGDTLYIRGDYRLFLDNLMDPSHVSFVHRTTLGTDDVAEIPQIASQDGDVVKVTRWILDRPVAPVYAKVSKLTKFGEFKNNVDRWQIMTFTAPHMVEVDMGSCLANTGALDGDRSQGFELYSYNLITPETETTSWYFWSHTRPFAHENQELSDTIRANFIEAFMEDIDVIEGVQAGLDRHPHLTPVNIGVDGGAIRARRVITKMIAREEDVMVEPEAAQVHAAE